MVEWCYAVVIEGVLVLTTEEMRAVVLRDDLGGGKSICEDDEGPCASSGKVAQSEDRSLGGA